MFVTVYEGWDGSSISIIGNLETYFYVSFKKMTKIYFLEKNRLSAWTHCFQQFIFVGNKRHFENEITLRRFLTQ